MPISSKKSWLNCSQFPFLKLRGWGLAIVKAHRCKPNQHSHGNSYSERPSAEIRAAAQDVRDLLHIPSSGRDLAQQVAAALALRAVDGQDALRIAVPRRRQELQDVVHKDLAAQDLPLVNVA